MAQNRFANTVARIRRILVDGMFVRSKRCSTDGTSLRVSAGLNGRSECVTAWFMGIARMLECYEMNLSGNVCVLEISRPLPGALITGIRRLALVDELSRIGEARDQLLTQELPIAKRKKGEDIANDG